MEQNDPQSFSSGNDLSRPMMDPGLLAKASSGIILIDPDTHNVADINNEAVAILGIPREVILNQKCVSSVCLGLSENCPF